MPNFDAMNVDSEALSRSLAAARDAGVFGYHLENQFQYETIAVYLRVDEERMADVVGILQRFLKETRRSSVTLSVLLCAERGGTLHDVDYLSGDDEILAPYPEGGTGWDEEPTDPAIAEMLGVPRR